MRKILVAITSITFAVGAVGAQPADTTKISRDPLFTPRDALIAGAFVLGTIAMYPIDRHFAERLQIESTQENRFLKNTAAGFRFMGTPGSKIIGASMYAIGRLGRVERMADLGLHGTEALFIASGVVDLVKGVAGRARPAIDVQDERNFKFARGFEEAKSEYRSFPSGHTALGFAAAAAVTSETAKWWPGSEWYIGPVMYGGAALIGVSRMYNNRHWASDVVMGAAIGTFSGLKVVRYHHSHPGNRIDKWLLAARVVPTTDGTALAWSITTR